MKSGRIIIPKVMQPEILQKIHYGHQGMGKCKLQAKSCVFWNNINQDMDKIVQGCVYCQEQQKTQCAKSLKPHEISVRLMANSSHGFVSVRQIALHVGG